MFWLTNLPVSLFFSCIGSIPPGTINLTVLQLGLENKTKTAIRFSLGAALMEYPYAWIAVKFENLITANPIILQNIRLSGAIIMIIIGVINLWPKTATVKKEKDKRSGRGFRHGIILGLLNPLAIPYWIGTTTLLHGWGLIGFPGALSLHVYLAGVVIGGFLTLLIFAYLARKVMPAFQSNSWITKIPGLTLVTIGIVYLTLYFMS